MTSPTIWNREPEDNDGGASIVLAASPPEGSAVGTVWGDLQATFFVNPDGTRDTDG